jgi:hypothetical protein
VSIENQERRAERFYRRERIAQVEKEEPFWRKLNARCKNLTTHSTGVATALISFARLECLCS